MVLGIYIYIYIQTLWSIRLYADDTKVFREISKTDDQMSLQTNLNNMLQWSQDSLLRFHPDKCVWMRIGKSPQDQDNPPTQVYMMDNKYLAHSSEEKDLGVVIDTDLKFDKHMTSKASKANQIAAFIRRSFEHLDCDTFNVLFTILVRPPLAYTQSVWSPYLKVLLQCRGLLRLIR